MFETAAIATQQASHTVLLVLVAEFLQQKSTFETVSEGIEPAHVYVTSTVSLSTAIVIVKNRQDYDDGSWVGYSHIFITLFGHDPHTTGTPTHTHTQTH